MRLLIACCVGALVTAAASAKADPPPITADLSDPPLYGMKDGLVYLRDPKDALRFYPHTQLDLDAHSFWGPGTDTLTPQDAGADLATRFFVRRARFDLGGEFFKRAAFDVGLDLVANPAIDGTRADSTSTRVALADAWVKLDAGRGLGLTLGVFQAPFSLENRTATSELAMMERNVAIRGLVAPQGKALGVSINGSGQYETTHWDIGAFGAESVSPGVFERHFDGIGRFYTRPWASTPGHLLHQLQIGVSARAGVRHPRDVTEDTSAITTGQGFAMWRPTRIDDLGRTVHVIPSGLQWGAGLELLVPIKGFFLRSEAYWISRDTRESQDGLQSTVTDRLGRMQGIGWYAEASIWPLQMAGLVSEVPLPQSSPHADHLELARAATLPERRGVEIAVLGAGINATYDGASRAGPADPSVLAKNIEIYQFGAALNFWHSRHLRLSINGNMYLVPKSGSAANAAIVPGNIGSPPFDRDTHTLWELGARTTFMF